MRQKNNRYRAAFAAEFRDEFKNEKTTYLNEIIDAKSLEDAYNEANKIVENLNKTGTLGFRVLSIERI